jgi:hypothetical protein
MVGIILLFLPFFIFNLFSYSPYNTHQVLTEEIANFYNLTTEGRKISLQEIEWMKKGAEKEDYPPRWVHHFYDPLTGQGWTGKRLGKLTKEDAFQKLKDAGLLPEEPVSSIDWAHNIEKQTSWDEDHTWEYGITAYAMGNYEKAFTTLGHILHLLEDLTVPEHTRDDAHPDIGILKIIFPSLSDGSLYEEWAKEYTLENYNNLNLAKNLLLKNEKPYKVNSLKEAFHNLASFTNKNFFSPDTINDSEFPEPRIEKLKLGYIKINDVPTPYLLNTNDIPILKIVENNNTTTYIIDKIVTRYIWETVTPELLKYGAGLIELFIKEGESLKPDADIEALYIYKRSLTQIGRKIAIWNIHQTSPLTQITRMFNNFDKLAYQSRLLYKNTIGKILDTKNQKSDQLPEILDKIPEVASFNEKISKDITENSLNLIQNSQNIQKQEVKISYENKKQIKEESNIQQKETSQLLQKETETKDNLKNKQTIQESKKEIAKTENKQTNLLKPVKIEENKKEIESLNNKTATTSQKIEKPKTSGGGGGGGGYVGGGSIVQPKDKCKEIADKGDFPKIIINAIKFEGENTKDEFVELYNPNDFDVDLTCFSLVKKTAGEGEGEFSNLVSKSDFTGKIPAKSFFLIVHPSSTYNEIKDLQYSSASYSISKNNVVAILNPKGEIVDLVGFGDNESKIRNSETKPFIFSKLNEDEFIERKNLKDTDNNFEDFWITKRSPYNTKKSKLPHSNFVELKNFAIEYFEIIPQNSKLYIKLKELNIPSSTQIFKNKLTFSTSIPEVSFELSYDNQEKIFIYDFCPNKGNYIAEFKIYDESNEINFVATSTKFEIPEGFCNKNVNYKILFSEILIEGENSYDEFIEIYNPNNFEIDLSGWKIVKKTKSGRETTILSNRTEPKLEGKIKPYGYFLISNSSSSFKDAADLVYNYNNSKALSENNTLVLINPEGKEVDKIGWGDALEFETKATQNPDKNYSLERKKSKNSNLQSLNTTEKDFGNFYDSDNNEFDFILQQNPNPENSNVIKPPKNKPTNFKVETVYSNLNTGGKALSWWFKARKENQIMKFLWNQPGALLSNSSKYSISYIFSTTSDFSNLSEDLIKDYQKTYLDINLPEIKDDGSLVEVQYNICNLKSGYYRFFLEIEDGENKNEVAFYNFFRSPHLFPCPPEKPNVQYTIYEENGRTFLKLFYEDGKDYDFIATDIPLETIYSDNFPKYRVFYIFKLSTNTEDLLGDFKFYEKPDFIGFYPDNFEYDFVERQMIYDLTPFEPGKTYYIGIRTISPYDFFYYGVVNKYFTNEPLSVCKSGNIFDSFHPNVCFLNHNGYPYGGYQNSPWAYVNDFYDPEGHQTPAPTYSTKAREWSAALDLIDLMKAYPHLVSSTTIISIQIPQKQYTPKFLKYVKFYKENNTLYADLKAKEDINRVHLLLFNFQPLKQNDFPWNSGGFYPRARYNKLYPSRLNINYGPDSIWVELGNGCYSLPFGNRTLDAIYTGEIINENCEQGRCNIIYSDKITKIEILKDINYDFDDEVFLMGIFYDVGWSSTCATPSVFCSVFCVEGKAIEIAPFKFGVEYNF